MAKGYSQAMICSELKVTRQTISSDMRYINEITQKGLFGLAKETLSTMYFNCIDGLNAALNEAWRIYSGEDNDPETTNKWHKIAALRLIAVINEKKCHIFANGPAFMELHRLDETVRKMRGNTFDEKGNLIRDMSDEELDRLQRITDKDLNEIGKP